MKRKRIEVVYQCVDCAYQAVGLKFGAWGSWHYCPSCHRHTVVMMPKEGNVKDAK